MHSVRYGRQRVFQNERWHSCSLMVHWPNWPGGVTCTCATKNKDHARCRAAALASTVAILPQGTSRALASQQTFLRGSIPRAVKQARHRLSNKQVLQYLRLAAATWALQKFEASRPRQSIEASGLADVSTYPKLTVSHLLTWGEPV